MRERNNLQEELDEALKECSRLRDENKYLRSQLELDNPFDGQQSLPEPTQKAITSSSVNNGSTNEAKIALFRNLFCGREDVYPVRWLSKAGKAGYSPACRHE